MAAVVATELNARLIDQLKSVHALKAGALRMFDPMLAAVAAERSAPRMRDVGDLLERMHRVFSAHRQETAAHVEVLEGRLRALDREPSRGRVAGMSVGATARARIGAVGGQNHGANARDAFVFEHLEIACLALLEELALRSDDAQTAAAAHDCRVQDELMAATINRNWTNVLTLMLASQGLPTARPDSGDGG
ncbi:MAG: DUF892 family protein [Solirubrobacteraceae bacterium]